MMIYLSFPVFQGFPGINFEFLPILNLPSLHVKSEYHANDPLRAYVYVLCLSATELYISGHI